MTALSENGRYDAVDDKKWGVFEMQIGLPEGADSGLINGCSGAGPYPKVVRHPEKGFAYFDTEKEAQAWAELNGYDPRLIDTVIVRRFTPNPEGRFGAVP